MPDPKTVKNRLHSTCAGGTRTGGRTAARAGRDQLADRRPGPGSGWVVLADPEGNELCVLRGELERPDPYAHL